MNKIPKIIKGKGLPDNYCIKAKDFISDEDCKRLNQGKKIKEMEGKRIDIRDIRSLRGNISTYKDFDILADWIEKYGLDISKEFSKQGYTEFPKQLALEISIAIDYSPEYWLDKDLRKLVDNFIETLNKCKELALATDGIK